MNYAQPSTQDAVRRTSSSPMRRRWPHRQMGVATEWFDSASTPTASPTFPRRCSREARPKRRSSRSPTFAISFLVRPLGGLFWGPLGDRPRAQACARADHRHRCRSRPDRRLAARPTEASAGGRPRPDPAAPDPGLLDRRRVRRRSHFHGGVPPDENAASAAAPRVRHARGLLARRVPDAGRSVALGTRNDA